MALAVAGLVVWYSGGGPIESVAVLPLVNATNDPALEYLSDGITESLINSLSQIPRLKVMSRNSVFRLKGRDTDAREVGRTLGVRGVLTGRLARRGDSLAVSLELSDAKDNSQIWGQQYAGRLAEVFALQESMARDITNKMRVKLTGAEEQRLAQRPTENLKAFESYMQSRAFAYRRTCEDLLRAVEFNEKAIAEDGDYALDDRLAEAHVALAEVYVLFAPYDFPLVERELQRATTLNPSLAAAHNYRAIAHNRQSQFDAAAAEGAKARELEARSGETLSQAHWIAKIYAALHEKALAFSWLDRGLAVKSIGDFYRDEPVWDPIRTDPRFADFERRIGNAP